MFSKSVRVFDVKLKIKKKLWGSLYKVIFEFFGFIILCYYKDIFVMYGFFKVFFVIIGFDIWFF